MPPLTMSVEAILPTDFFIPLPQPTAPSETLPRKSGIKITRKPMAPFIPAAEIVTLPNDVDFGIRSEPSTSTPIKTSTQPQTQVLPLAQVKTSVQVKQPPQSKPSTSAQTSAQVKSPAQAKPSTPAHDEPSTSNESVSTLEAIEILDFQMCYPQCKKIFTLSSTTFFQLRSLI